MKRLALGFGTAMGAAGVSVFLGVPAAWVVLALWVLGGHELAHLITAQAAGAQGYIFFIPLGIFMLGITRLLNLPRGSRPAVALAGGVAGLGGLLASAPAAVLLGCTSVAALLILTELYSIFWGRDAKLRRE